jgi:hypothetical protein
MWKVAKPHLQFMGYFVPNNNMTVHSELWSVQKVAVMAYLYDPAISWN